MIRHLLCVLPLVVGLVGCATTNSGTSNAQVYQLGLGRYRIRIDDRVETSDFQMSKALELKASKVASDNGFRNADILKKRIFKGTANTSQGSYPVKIIDAEIQCHYLKLGDAVATKESRQGPGEKKAPKQSSGGGSGSSGGSTASSSSSGNRKLGGGGQKPAANENRPPQNTINRSSGGASRGTQQGSSSGR